MPFYVQVFTLYKLSSVFLHCDQKKILGMISVLNLLRLVSWPEMWFVLEKVPCTFERNAYSPTVGQRVHMSVRSS